MKVLGGNRGGRRQLPREGSSDHINLNREKKVKRKEPLLKISI